MNRAARWKAIDGYSNLNYTQNSMENHRSKDERHNSLAAILWFPKSKILRVVIRIYCCLQWKMNINKNLISVTYWCISWLIAAATHICVSISGAFVVNHHGRWRKKKRFRVEYRTAYLSQWSSSVVCNNTTRWDAWQKVYIHNNWAVPDLAFHSELGCGRACRSHFGTIQLHR